MKRVAGTFTVLALAVFALAMGSYTKVFNDTYKVGKDTVLGKAGCAACHVSAKSLKLTAYGLDMQKAMKEKGAKKLTPEVLRQIEKLDSNKNGKSNLDDIKAGQIP